MASIYGKNYTKQQLMRYVGSMSALAGVRSATLNSGKSDTVKIHEVTSGDLAFTLAESKNLDMVDLKYKGMPLNFTSSVGGVVNHGLSDQHGFNFLYDNAGGMLYTAGYSNVGSMFGDDETEPFHGRIRFQPANNIKIISEWQGDDYVVGVQGETRETGLFKQNVCAVRTVSTRLGSKDIDIHTVVENQSFREQPLMNLLHINCGFPIVDNGAKVYVAYSSAEPLNDEGAADMDTRFDIVEPDIQRSESLTLHHLRSDKDGYTYAAVYNPSKMLGLAIAFKTEQYPMLIEWKCMMPGCYIMGLLPTNSGLGGQEVERTAGTLRLLKPFESAVMDMRLSVLDGESDFNDFMKHYKGCI